jgi:hypothetical protein
MKHVREAPQPPAAPLGRPVSPKLETLILPCLAKARGPARGRGALLPELERSQVSGT